MTDLSKIKTIHFTGIKGVGMTALALCAQDLNKKVTGSDLADIFPTSEILNQRKIKPQVGFKAQNLPLKLDLLIYTGAHGGAENPEVKSAQKRNIPCLNHAQGLKLFTKDKKTIAVAGVGGKTTTSALLATILETAKLNPSYAVGVGSIKNLSAPGKYDSKSKYFVAESDEYVADPQSDLTPRFHYLNPYLAVITNLEHDHPDVYPQFIDVLNSFQIFISKLPADGVLIANLDNPQIKNLIKQIKKPIITYGFSPQADWQITKSHTADQKQIFSLKYQKVVWPDLIINLPGKYNLLNAAGSVAAAYFLNLSFNQIKNGLKSFSGTKRRFEFIGEVNQIKLYDDYAHHPIEIKALLKAAKSWLPDKRIFAVFQSHTYSRTKAFLDQFAASFTDAYQVIINQIFTSQRETDNLGISGRTLANQIQKHHPRVKYCPDKQKTIDFLIGNLQPNDVIFTIGAGDNWLWHQDILKALK